MNMEERANEAETKTQTIIVFLLLSAKEILHLHGKGLSIYLHEFSVTATWETHLRYFELCMGEKIAFLILFSCYIAYYYRCFVRVFVISCFSLLDVIVNRYGILFFVINIMGTVDICLNNCFEYYREYYISIICVFTARDISV